MKAETLRTYYRGPTVIQTSVGPAFQWSQKRRGYPRRVIRLVFNSVERAFDINVYVKRSRRLPDWPELIESAALEAVLRSLLNPEHIALCTAAAIAAPRPAPQGHCFTSVPIISASSIVRRPP
jgi:hypothetical protein